MSQNLEPVQQGLIKQRNGEEAPLVAAFKAYKIKASSIEEIKNALTYCMVKVGLKEQNFPEAEEKSLLISHVISNYGNHTVDEVRLAFDMAITEKLDVNPVCYENFSCLYFSSIMNAYRHWSAQVVKFMDNQVKEQAFLPAPPMSDEEIIENAFGVWKYTKRFEFISESSYDALVRTEKINLTNEQKHALMDAAIVTIIDIEGKDPNAFKSGNRKDFQKLFSKKMAVRNYFQTIPNE